MNARPADRLAIAIAQLNPIVGDVAGNAEKARRARRQAADEHADLIVFPELFIAGYPPEDLVLKPAFQAACRSAVEALARETADGGPAVVIGTPWVAEGKLYNAAVFLEAAHQLELALLLQERGQDLLEHALHDAGHVHLGGLGRRGEGLVGLVFGAQALADGLQLVLQRLALGLEAVHDLAVLVQQGLFLALQLAQVAVAGA